MTLLSDHRRTPRRAVLTKRGFLNVLSGSMAAVSACFGYNLDGLPDRLRDAIRWPANTPLASKANQLFFGCLPLRRLPSWPRKVFLVEVTENRARGTGAFGAACVGEP